MRRGEVMKLGRLLCALIVACWAAATPVQAQNGSGAVSGRVTDHLAEAVPGVAVTVTEARTALTRVAVTGADGVYVIASLPPGTYSVRAELSGFRAHVRQGVSVTTGEGVRVDLRLEVGSVSEAITVHERRAAAPQ